MDKIKNKYKSVGRLFVSKNLYNFVLNELLRKTKIKPKQFWSGLEKTLYNLREKNENLIKIRKDLQNSINWWHLRNKGKKFNLNKYKKFLVEIGYLKKKTTNFKIQTKNVDDEIARIPGPQLVVPVSNARYALNAANARWGSLYDALYGTDAIGSEKLDNRYNPVRGGKVIRYCREFLDEIFPLKNGSWKKVNTLKIIANKLVLKIDNKNIKLKNIKQYKGHRSDKKKLKGVLLVNNNLHVELIINPYAFSANNDPIGLSDLVIESAVSTIIDHEDSVAAVDAEDKVLGYRNWLGLMKGDLKVKFEKLGKKYERFLNSDRNYISSNGKNLRLHGRALLLNRNVGHLMKTPAILFSDKSPIPEGILDAFMTSAACLHDLNRKKNSRTGSIYIVKPKMHGPDEVSFADEIFSKVEDVLNLKRNTVKIGIMDEERRTSSNLKECIKRVKKRVVFINTGFLDRTGDEMHTSMEAGPMMKKGDMKNSKWIKAYENNNVKIGLECGFSGKAQIGKGMWAAPDKMQNMLVQKINHPKSGANCAWTPSPTAATLHAMHYHKINVFDVQKKIKNKIKFDLNGLLSIPIIQNPIWNVDDIRNELENNCQGILGYVVRWIDSGVGCSKVPDINNIGLMEDRATLRISSQHISNWLHHNICTTFQVLETLKKMAKIVDDQNKNDSNYEKMSKNFEKSIAFKTACDLIFKGKDQPSGYTEPLLHYNRYLKKN
ncbi:malate synthase G [Candidatus Pelagibacter communis]|uniref:malate synthase G n=1 Tax=Pelagibacter ubique TaxID=198252 RepID=UPI00094C3C4D|nr:malate synthase G [Candidatus Pelagibacter ubique]